MDRSIPVALSAWLIIISVVVSCGGDDGENGNHEDGESLIDQGQRYAESREFRRQILESSLENPDNFYSRTRLNNYGIKDQGWETLPVHRPSMVPITSADYGTFDEQGRRGAIDSPPATKWDGPWEHEALLELGERAFESYPMRVDPRLAPVVESPENTVQTGFWRDDRDRIGGIVAQQLDDGTQRVAWTCATCHGSVRQPGGPLILGRSNAMIDSGELYRLGGRDDSIVGDWLPGQIDSSQDGVDNPTAIPDLRPVRYQSHLHAAASITNDLMALTVRVETLLITSQMGNFRPPRQLAFAIAYYLWNLPLPHTDPPDQQGQAPQGQEIFEQQCSACHHTDGGVEAPLAYHLIGTDPAAAQSPARTTGRYRIPTLAGVGDRPYLLHDGSLRSLDAFLSPGRQETVPGHVYGLDLSPEEREALIEFLGALPLEE